MRRCWAILTGAYPPAPGGVGDYTRVVARALATAGDEVHVITSAGGCDDAGVRVHHADCGIPGIGGLSEVIDRLPPHRELLVQYTPYAFGLRGMNLALPLWLRMRSSRERITVMFHEVMYPIKANQPVAHNLLGRVHRRMATWLAQSARRALVATPRWGEILRDSCAATCPIDWAPVPSNLPTSVDAACVAAVRSRYVQPDQRLIGHFGTYGRWIGEMLEPLIPHLLANPKRRTLLLGQGSPAFRDRLIARYPSLRAQLEATGALDESAAAAHLAACDVLVQPYPDGVTARRSSIMAGLALGVPTVTNAGELTEPLWVESDAVAIARGPDPRGIIDVADALFQDAGRRAALSQRAKRLYQERFAVERTVEILRDGAAR